MQLIHGNVAHKVVLDMYLLPALAAGLVRCFHIDRLDKLSEGIGGQLREGAVPLYPLNKLLYILCLLLESEVRIFRIPS